MKERKWNMQLDVDILGCSDNQAKMVHLNA